MDIATLAQFLDHLEKSQLLAPEKLAAVRKSAAGQTDSRAFARGLAKQGLLTRWQAGQLLLGRTSYTLGKYRLLDLLGHGGMGHVFLAEHTTMQRRAALKLLPAKLSRDPEARKRFLAEARAAAALDHANIVRAYDVQDEGDRYYLVMEHVDGKDLAEVVKDQGPLDFATAADAIRQAAAGLAHAYDREMVHGDIKPSNLLVNKQGTVKILSMGLAQAGGERPDDETEPPAEAVDYLAPERTVGEGDFDQRADIYSLGCTLYFLLSGEAPFAAGTIEQRITKHQEAQPTSLLKIRPDTPKDLVRICRKMMAKDPAQRYQTAAEVSQALEAWAKEHQQPKSALAADEAGAQSSDSLADILGVTTEGAARAAPTKKSGPGRRESPAAKKAEPKGRPEKGRPARDKRSTPAAKLSPADLKKRQLWIGGAAVGGVVVMTIVGIVVFSLSGKEKPLAKAPVAPKVNVAVETKQRALAKLATDSVDDTEDPPTISGSTSFPKASPAAEKTEKKEPAPAAKPETPKSDQPKPATPAQGLLAVIEEDQKGGGEQGQKGGLRPMFDGPAPEAKGGFGSGGAAPAKPGAPQGDMVFPKPEEEPPPRQEEPIFSYPKDTSKKVQQNETKKLNVRDELTIMCAFRTLGPPSVWQTIVSKVWNQQTKKGDFHVRNFALSPKFDKDPKKATGELTFSYTTLDKGKPRQPMDVGGFGFTPEPGKWHEIAVTLSTAEKKLRLYVDGALRKEVPMKNPGPLALNNSAISIANGFEEKGKPTGWVGNVRIWNRALPADEIIATQKKDAAERAKQTTGDK